MSNRVPAIFLAHGAPPLLDDKVWMGELAAWARAMPRPKSILMISAHWEVSPITLAATKTVPLFYDFYGFPERYYQTQYPAPGAPDLASRIRSLIPGVASDETRGLDHGAYVPLVAMYPEADVPVLQMSIPTLAPKPLLELGKSLASLRDEGVLIVGSGFLTHNLRTVSFKGGPPPQWASEFDDWIADVLSRRDVDQLMQYRERAPGANYAHPTHEHFVPVIAAMGAALEDKTTFPITGFAFATASKRSAQFG